MNNKQIDDLKQMLRDRDQIACDAKVPHPVNECATAPYYRPNVRDVVSQKINQLDCEAYAFRELLKALPMEMPIAAEEALLRLLK